MTVHYADDWLTVLHGDVRDELRTLPDESVHCVVTSPPYWGLRDYGDATQLGLEPTPEQYVENMVAVFREVRRVLRSDGTLWLNLGDSYNTSPPGNKPNTTALSSGLPNSIANQEMRRSAQAGIDKTKATGLKPKDLVGIPWRVAFALQADGWYLRSDIIWSKPNPMPESVTDRPTKSHEYLFLLSKSARYYFDADAVREANSPLTVEVHGRYDQETDRHKHADEFSHKGTLRVNGRERDINGRNIRSVWTIATAPYPGAHFATFPPKLVEPCIKAGTSEKGVCPECGAPWERVDAGVNEPDLDRPQTKRAWELFRQGQFTGEHLDAVRAVGITDTGKATITQSGTGKNDPHIRHLAAEVKLALRGYYRELLLSKRRTVFEPSCKCARAAGVIPPVRAVPATVLDPFAGSGTTGMVAQSLSRRAVLIDLNVDYLGQLMERNREIPLGLESA